MNIDVRNSKYPKGLFYIIGNEAAERFSYYGMLAVLQVFMTHHLLDHNGELASLSENEASRVVHLFKMGVYVLPLFGGLLADVFLGKYRSIMILSIVYCLGHIALAIDISFTGLAIGLGLLCIGAGGIKSCSAAHVGDQFDVSNDHLMGRVYDYFYMAINLGASVSMMLTPYLLDNPNYGPHWAFGVPGVFMVLATIMFFVGRNKFIAVPATGLDYYLNNVLTRDNLKVLGKVSVIFFCFLPFFWALFDQTSSTWITQMKSMDNNFSLFGASIRILPSQLQSFNPVYILVLAPFFSRFIYPKTKWDTLDKMVIGFFVAGSSFLLLGYVQLLIDGGDRPTFLYQALAYLIITIAEVMVSITVLEYAYRNSPKVMKSFVMGLFYFSIFLGNFIVYGVLELISSVRGVENLLHGANHFFFYAGLIFAVGVIFQVSKKLLLSN